jgi:hypothetical protein
MNDVPTAECASGFNGNSSAKVVLRALAKRFGINQKTVAKWKIRETVADLPTGPKEAKSPVLSIDLLHNRYRPWSSML